MKELSLVLAVVVLLVLSSLTYAEDFVAGEVIVDIKHEHLPMLSMFCDGIKHCCIEPSLIDRGVPERKVVYVFFTRAIPCSVFVGSLGIACSPGISHEPCAFGELLFHDFRVFVEILGDVLDECREYLNTYIHDWHMSSSLDTIISR